MIWLYVTAVIGVAVMAVRNLYQEGHLGELKAWVLRLDQKMQDQANDKDRT